MLTLSLLQDQIKLGYEPSNEEQLQHLLHTDNIDLFVNLTNKNCWFADKLEDYFADVVNIPYSLQTHQISNRKLFMVIESIVLKYKMKKMSNLN
jgi:hypothetical protein